MARASFFTVLKISGVSTQFATNEDMQNIENNLLFQIIDSDKEIWDRTIEPIFFEDGVQIDDEDIENINYLFGRVLFNVAKTGDITVMANYMPTSEVAEATDHTFSLVGEILDNTAYKRAKENNGFRTRIYGLRDVNVSLTRFYSANNHFIEAWENLDVFLLEHRPAPNVDAVWRGWFIAESADVSGGVDDIENIDITLQLDGDVNASFSMEF